MDLVTLFNLDVGFRAIILGPGNSGKSSFIRKFAYETKLRRRRDGLVTGFYDKIYVCAPDAVHNPNYDYADLCINGPENTKETISRLLKFQQDLRNRKLRMPKVLLIIEDYSGMFSQYKVEAEMRLLATTSRHCSISFLIVSHIISNVPPIIRNNITHLIICGRPVVNKYIAECTSYPKYQLDKIVNDDDRGDYSAIVIQFGAREASYVPIEREYATQRLE